MRWLEVLLKSMSLLIFCWVTLLIIAMDWIVSPINLYVEALTSSVVVVGDTRDSACASSFSLPCEGTSRRWLSANWKRAVTRIRPCCCSDLRLPASRTVRKYFLLFESSSLWYCVMVSYTDKDSYWERGYWNNGSKIIYFYLWLCQFWFLCLEALLLGKYI